MGRLFMLVPSSSGTAGSSVHFLRWPWVDTKAKGAAGVYDLEGGGTWWNCTVTVPFFLIKVGPLKQCCCRVRGIRSQAFDPLSIKWHHPKKCSLIRRTEDLHRSGTPAGGRTAAGSKAASTFPWKWWKRWGFCGLFSECVSSATDRAKPPPVLWRNSLSACIRWDLRHCWWEGQRWQPSWRWCLTEQRKSQIRHFLLHIFWWKQSFFYLFTRYLHLQQWENFH